MSHPRAVLLEGSVPAHIRRLAGPLAWGLLMINIFSIIDAYFISYLGTDQLAAFGFCMPVVMLFMGTIFGFCIGTTSAMARIYGRGDMDLLRRMTNDALVLAALISVAAAILGGVLIDPVFRLMGAPQNLMPMIHDFMRYWYMGLPFLFVMMTGNAVIRATGDTVFPSRMMTLQAILLIIIDPLLIFGWGGFPRMELKGAALALAIIYMICFFVSIYVLGFKRKILSRDIWHRGVFVSWRRIMHVALPSIASNQILPLSTVIITWMAARFGNEAVAAFGVAGRIEGMVMMVNYALGSGIAVFIGQNFGAGNMERVRDAVRTASKYALFYGIFVATLLWFTASLLASVFSDNVLVHAYVTQYFHWVPVSYGALGAMLMGNASFNATGRPWPGTVVILLKSFILYVPLAYMLQARFGFTGILMALAATNFIVGFVSYVWSMKGKHLI